MLSLESRNVRDGNEEGLLRNQDESGLVSRARSGDGHAFVALIEPNFHRIYVAAMKITRNHEDAEDACQESFLKAFVHMQNFRGNAQFSTWLTRIATNEALMKIRKRQVEARYRSNEGDLWDSPFLTGLRDQTTTSDPETQCIQSERKELLREAIDGLETKSKLAICEFGFGEKETREIAKASHLSTSGMKSRLERAMRKLRERLAPMLIGKTEQIRHLS
jgi:RNA polymerase sigma-70 factor (ECF subfamily)